jgi:taurine dioxygenase
VQVGQLPIGVEVAGLDLRDELRAGDVAELRVLFDEQHLLLFRGQRLTGDRQADVAGLFRPVVREKAGRFGYVSNVRRGAVVPEGALPFHSDFAFTDEPVLGLSLHALVVPAGGAPTRFADAERVLDLMPVDLRARIEALRILNVYDFGLPTDRRMRDADLSPGSPRTERTFVGRHPITGVRVINANAMHTDRVLGLAPDESEALLREVFSVLYGSANTYEHRWAVGDLVIWDNIAVHHGRDDFPLTEERTLQRVCLGTKTADEMVPNLQELLARAAATS